MSEEKAEIQKTLVLVKSDGVIMGETGKVITFLEERKLKIVGMKMILLSKDQIAEHYKVHKDLPFYPRALAFLSDMAPVVAMIVEGVGAISLVRKMFGNTRPYDADMGTLRESIGHMSEEYANLKEIPIMNRTHASGNEEEAEEEIRRFFTSDEIFDYPNSEDLLTSYYHQAFNKNNPDA